MKAMRQTGHMERMQVQKWSVCGGILLYSGGEGQRRKKYANEKRNQ